MKHSKFIFAKSWIVVPKAVAKVGSKRFQSLSTVTTDVPPRNLSKKKVTASSSQDKGRIHFCFIQKKSSFMAKSEFLCTYTDKQTNTRATHNTHTHTHHTPHHTRTHGECNSACNNSTHRNTHTRTCTQTRTHLFASISSKALKQQQIQHTRSHMHTSCLTNPRSLAMMLVDSFTMVPGRRLRHAIPTES